MFGAGGHRGHRSLKSPFARRDLRGGLQAEHRQLLGIAFALDQAWIVQREAATQFAFQNSLQLAVIDFAVGADGFLEFFR
ncbi:hypothetical protein D9M69_654700 [compost metagenome]